MSDDSETVEDTEKGSLAEVTDDSCTVEFTDIIPRHSATDDCRTPEFIDPVVVVKPEDLLEIKHEPADEINNGDADYSVKQEPADEYETELPLCFTIHVSAVIISWFGGKTTVSEQHLYSLYKQHTY